MTQVHKGNAAVMGGLGRLLEASRWTRRLLARHVLSERPAADRLLADPKALDRYLRDNVMSVSHVSGTCRMGRADDPDAVVDPADGRVHGVENLHVVDASIMPSVPQRQHHLAVIMIAEKMADAILGADIPRFGTDGRTRLTATPTCGAARLDQATAAA